MTVLVVDDDPGIRALLQMVLQRDDYSVLAAAEGGEALEILRSQVPIAVILLDLKMPRMDGHQFRRLQLGDPAFASIPVIVLTGYEVTPEQSVELKAFEIVHKPFKPESLLATVRAAIREPVQRAV